MGPCQGGFCIYRATGILHGLDGIDSAQANSALLDFLQERWKGVWPILYGDQLRQARLDDWIFQGVLDVSHLPHEPERALRRVVMGAGVAGLTAATRLAEGGARVCVLAKGVGSTHLRPARSTSSATTPSASMSPPRRSRRFIGDHPDHPYALVGSTAIAPALEWFAGCVERGPQPGYRYIGGLDHNHLLPTAVGASARPRSSRRRWPSGDLRREIAGVRRRAAACSSDFHPSLCAGNLRRAGIAARAVEIDVEVGRVEANTLGAGADLDEPPFRAAFAARTRPAADAGRARGPAGDPRSPRPPRGLVRPRAPARPRRVRDPDVAAVGSGHAGLQRAARRTSRRRRPPGAGRRGGRAPSARAIA